MNKYQYCNILEVLNDFELQLLDFVKNYNLTYCKVENKNELQ